MKLKTARRVLSRNSWRISRSIVESGKIKPASLNRRVKEAIGVIQKEKNNE